jgi:hypothetical protein
MKFVDIMLNTSMYRPEMPNAWLLELRERNASSRDNIIVNVQSLTQNRSVYACKKTQSVVFY